MTLTRDAIIGFIVLAIVVIGCIWYTATHPAPVAEAPGTGGTGTQVTVTGPQDTTEHADLYDVDMQYPGSTALVGLPDSADVDAVALMKQWETDTDATFKQNFTNLDAAYLQHLQSENLKGSLTITYTTHATPHTVSYVYTVFMDTLGAHPNTTYKTFTFDTTDGQELALGNLFDAGTDYLAEVSKIARAQLPPMIAARENVDVSQIDMDMLNAGTEPTEDNFADFYLDGTNLVILFPPYAVGPYVLGSSELDIPTASLTGFKAIYP